MSIKGNVYWITGLSGAGKTSIGKLFFEKIKQEEPNTIFLDGDELRLIFNDEPSFSMESRLTLSYLYSKLCNLLANQNLNVVIATISMFEEITSSILSSKPSFSTCFNACFSDLASITCCDTIFSVLVIIYVFISTFFNF